MARASCRPGCNPHGGCPPRRGEYSELCPAANGDTEARKLGVGSGRGSAGARAAALVCLPEPRLLWRARAGHSPISPWGLRDQCTAVLSRSQSCPHLTNHTSVPASSSPHFPLYSRPVCLETMQAVGSRDTSGTAAKSVLSRTQKGCLPGCGLSCRGAPASKGAGEMPLWFLERFHPRSAPHQHLHN